MMLNRILAALLAAMLLCCATAWAEGENPFSDDDEFEFDFADDGYTGEWVEIKALGIEYCQPEGWSQAQDAADDAYVSVNGEGTVRLTIRLAARDVDDVVQWGRDNLESYEVDEANFYDALVVETEKSVTIYIDASEDGLLAFEFTRKDGEALTREFALQIVGSTCEIWDDEDILTDGDGDFDFGEAFEADED